MAKAQTAAAPLQLEAKIPLGPVSGRIDHLAIDLKRQWLSVAELGNDSVGVIDVANRKLISTMRGFQEPQGIAYEPSTDTLYIANAGDGSVRLMRADDFTLLGRIDLGDDADNVRIDPQRGQVLVGYGKGALAVIDPRTRAKLADIPLKSASGKLSDRTRRRTGFCQCARCRADPGRRSRERAGNRGVSDPGPSCEFPDGAR